MSYVHVRPLTALALAPGALPGQYTATVTGDAHPRPSWVRLYARRGAVVDALLLVPVAAEATTTVVTIYLPGGAVTVQASALDEPLVAEGPPLSQALTVPVGYVPATAPIMSAVRGLDPRTASVHASGVEPGLYVDGSLIAGSRVLPFTLQAGLDGVAMGAPVAWPADLYARVEGATRAAGEAEAGLHGPACTPPGALATPLSSPSPESVLAAAHVAPLLATH